MKKQILLMSTLLLNVLYAAAQTEVPLADPFILLDGDTYYAYGTHSPVGIMAYTSKDLIQWREAGLALHRDNTTETRWFWAPEVYRRADTYYMFYSANEHLYLATATSPMGPFRQQGGLLMQELIGDEKCIDSSVFFDDDGRAYLYFVRFTDGNFIWMCDLNDELRPLPGTLRPCFGVTAPWELIQARVAEGPFVVKHDGIYYLTYSANHYESQDYAVGYATSPTPHGPWTKSATNPILHRHQGLCGTGHHSLFTDKNGQLHMVYHAHHSATEIHPRMMHIAEARFQNGELTIDGARDFQQAAALKPRLVVCTDIAPADVEPDDMQSMVRLMAYADLFEIEALITSVGWNCDPYPKEWIQYLHRVIDAYEKDVTNLMKRSQQQDFLTLDEENGSQRIGYWPSAAYIRGRAAMGSQRGGIQVIGEGNDSPGSDLLIRLADENDPRPIYVAAWGGANTLAQAIWRVKQTRSPEELKAFVRKFRIYTITDQDMQYSMRMNRAYSSHQWLRRDFPDDLQFIWDEGTWQEQCELGKQHWTQHQQHIHGKGALGREYPNYKWGVEGDTPSFLYVMPNGLNDPEDPSQAGWAGFHQRGICPDSLTTAWTSWQEPVRGISISYKQRFYPDEFNDFAARMQWADEGKGYHNPIVTVNDHTGPSPLVFHVKAGDTVRLDASSSYDPDHDIIRFHWWQQPEIGELPLTLVDTENAVTSFHIPGNAIGQSLHIICEVHDSSPFKLAAYQRIIVVVE